MMRTVSYHDVTVAGWCGGISVETKASLGAAFCRRRWGM